MKKLLLGIYLFFIPVFSFSQKTVELPNDTFQITNRKFYVSEVIDKRRNKKFIGELWAGAFKKTEKITVAGGINNYLQNWFLTNFPKTSDNQTPVKVIIRYIAINQSETYSNEVGKAYVGFDFINTLSYKQEVNSEITETTNDAFSTHPQRLIAAFHECVEKYNNSISDKYSESDKNEDDAVEIVFHNNKQNSNSEKYAGKPEKIRQQANRNVIAIGYQIGGYTLVGVDYEIRIHDYFGVHFGVGFLGFTGGIKVHTNPKKNSMFINLSWKDTGLGMYNGFGIEAGDRWIWSKKRDFGLYYQGGIFILNHINSDFEQILYNGSPAPPISLSLGLGISW